MSWLSILPAHLTTVETWIVRFFVSLPSLLPVDPRTDKLITQLFLGTITIFPWILALLYDMVLYLFRTAAYEIPYYGGRAQGERKPQPPTLTERPNGRPRTFSITGIAGHAGEGNEDGKRRSFDSSDGEGTNDLTEEGEISLRQVSGT